MSHHPDENSQQKSTFWVADLHASGDLRSCEPYHYELLQRIPGADDLIAELASNLYRSPGGFEIAFGRPEKDLSLRFAVPAPTAAIATLRALPDGALVSLSVLVCGTDPEADKITLDSLQKHLVRELRGTPHEPSFALLSLEKRPLVATMAFADPPSARAQQTAALLDRCLAAAFFRYHHLA